MRSPLVPDFSRLSLHPPVHPLRCGRGTAAGALLLALGLALLPVAAPRAATLGDMAVLSEFGEPLRAEIEVSDLSPAQAESLEAAIGSRADYASLGLRYPEALQGALVRLQRRPGGRVTVRVATRAPIAETEFNMVLALTTDAGRVLRNYQLISNGPPAGGATAGVAAAAPSAGATAPGDAPLRLDLVPVVPRAEAQQPAEPPRVAVAPAASAAAAAPFVPPVPPAQSTPAAGSAAARDVAPSGSRTVTVQRGETASAIARRFKPAGIDESQAVMALYRRNQAAFGGSIHRLPAGAQLALPDEAEMRQQPRHEARAAIRSRDEPAAPRAARPDRLVISGDDAAPADRRGRLGSASNATRTAALDAAKAEADSRVRDLQKNVDDLNRLLELRDRQLAKLQDTARRMTDEQAAAPASPSAAAGPVQVAAGGGALADVARPAADPATASAPPAPAPVPALRPVPVPEAAPPPSDWFSDWRIQAGAGVLAAVLVLAGVAITLRVSRPGASRGLTGGMRDWRAPSGGARPAARRG